LIFDLIFRRWMIQFGWNSAARCRTTRRLQRNGRYRNTEVEFKYGGRLFFKNW